MHAISSSTAATFLLLFLLLLSLPLCFRFLLLLAPSVVHVVIHSIGGSLGKRGIAAVEVMAG